MNEKTEVDKWKEISAKRIAVLIVAMVSRSSDRRVSYKELWEEALGSDWSTSSQGPMNRKLREVIQFCVRNDLAVVTALVVSSETWRLSRKAIDSIYRDAKETGMRVGRVASAFVHQQQQKAEEVTVETIERCSD